MLRRINWRAQYEKIVILRLFWSGSGGCAVSARARPCGARQSILLTKEMLFDSLIAIPAQKFEKIDCIELLPFLDLKHAFYPNLVSYNLQEFTFRRFTMIFEAGDCYVGQIMIHSLELCKLHQSLVGRFKLVGTFWHHGKFWVLERENHIVFGKYMIVFPFQIRSFHDIEKPFCFAPNSEFCRVTQANMRYCGAKVFASKAAIVRKTLQTTSTLKLLYCLILWKKLEPQKANF